MKKQLTPNKLQILLRCNECMWQRY